MLCSCGPHSRRIQVKSEAAVEYLEFRGSFGYTHQLREGWECFRAWKLPGVSEVKPGVRCAPGEGACALERKTGTGLRGESVRPESRCEIALQSGKLVAARYG